MIDYTQAQLVRYDMTDPQGDKVTLNVGSGQIVVYRYDIHQEFTRLRENLGHEHPQIQAGFDLFRSMNQMRLGELYKGKPDDEINGEQIGL